MSRAWVIGCGLVFAALWNWGDPQTARAGENSGRSFSNFDRQREFPNYFLPRSYRYVSIESIPPEVLASSQKRLEDAMKSVLARMEIVIFIKGQAEPQKVKYLEFIQQEVSKVSDSIKVLPSGGLVRAALSYIYYRLSMSADRGISPEEALESLAAEQGRIAAHEIRGVGSDVDVLLLTNDSNREHFQTAQSLVLQITNSSESRFNAFQFKSSYKRALFPIGDAKNYEEQTRRSTRQGGAAIDFLAFDMSEGKFVEPANKPGIVKHLLMGRYEYLAPEDPKFVEDADKQTIRGMRSLIELPFLAIQDETEIRKEIAALMLRLSEGRKLGPKALEQFDKMVRNARFSGGHNRFFRGGPGSLEEEIHQLLKAVEKVHQRASVPEYVDSNDLGDKPSIPEDLEMILTPVQEFISEFTNDGFLEHGTPRTENSLSIIRGGFFVSKPEGLLPLEYRQMATAVEGRAAYFSASRDVAARYAGSDGVVFRLGVRKDERVRVLNLRKYGKHPVVEAIFAKAKQVGRDPHEYLAREFGIDWIIAPSHILCQNSEAINPIDFSELINGYGSIIQNPLRAPLARLHALRNYRSLYGLGFAMGLDGLLVPVSDEVFVKSEIYPWYLQSPDQLNEGRAEALSLIWSFLIDHPDEVEKLSQTALQDGSVGERAREILARVPSYGNSGVLPKIEPIIFNPDYKADFRWKLLERLLLNPYGELKNKDVIVQAISDLGMRTYLESSIVGLESEDPDVSIRPKVVAYQLLDLDLARKLAMKRARSDMVAGRRPPDLPIELKKGWPTSDEALILYNYVYGSSEGMSDSTFTKLVQASKTKNPQVLLLALGRTERFDVGEMKLNDEEIVTYLQSPSYALSLGTLRWIHLGKRADPLFVDLVAKTMSDAYGTMATEAKQYLRWVMTLEGHPAKDALRSFYLRGISDLSSDHRVIWYRWASIISDLSDAYELLKMAESPDDVVRAGLFSALGQSNIAQKDWANDSRIKETFRKLLNDPVPEVSQTALSFFAQWQAGDSVFQDHLVSRWNFPVASEALMRPGVPLTVPMQKFLIQRLSSADVDERKEAYAILATQIIRKNNPPKEVRDVMWDFLIRSRAEFDQPDPKMLVQEMLQFEDLIDPEVQRKLFDYMEAGRFESPAWLMDGMMGKWHPKMWADLERMRKSAPKREAKNYARAALLSEYPKRPIGWTELTMALWSYKRDPHTPLSRALIDIHQRTTDHALARRIERTLAKSIRSGDILAQISIVTAFRSKLVPKLERTVDLLADLVDGGDDEDNSGFLDGATADIAYEAVMRLTDNPKPDLKVKEIPSVVEPKVRARANLRASRFGPNAGCREKLINLRVEKFFKEFGWGSNSDEDDKAKP